MKYKILLLFFFWMSGHVLAQLPLNDVPLNHPVYSFIEKISTKGQRKFKGLNQRPWTRLQVKEYLESVSGDTLTTKILNVAEKSLLEEYLIEFSSDSKKKKWSYFPIARRIYESIPLLKWFYANKWNFFTYRSEKLKFSLKPQMRLVKWQRKASNKEEETHFTAGYEIAGQYGQHIGFYWNLVDNSFSGDVTIKDRDVWKDSGFPFVVRNKESFEWNENIFFITFQWKKIDAMIGRNFLQWGPGERDRIILSTNAPAFDQMKLRFTSKYVHYTIVTGKLFAPVDSIRSIKNMPDIPKYLAAQRIDFFPADFLQIGWTQLIVYANRNFVLGYNLPFSFFKSSEHYYGDRDNGLMAVDFQLFPFRNVSLYFTWLFDDLTTSKIGTDFYGNKFAFQYGLKILGVPIIGINTDWFLEYIKIDPYVYSHRFYNETEYKHYDSHLGSFLEPNSDMLYLKNKMALTRNFSFKTEFEYIRHGENLPNLNVGGSVDTPHELTDPEDVPFLSGKKNYISRLFFTVSYQYFHRSHIFFTYAKEKITGKENTSHLWFGLTFDFGYRPYSPIYRF